LETLVETNIEWPFSKVQEPQRVELTAEDTHERPHVPLPLIFPIVVLYTD